MTDSTIISDPYRIPVTAQRLEDGRIILHTPGRQAQFLSVSEVKRLYEFSVGLGTLVRHTAQ